jgi:hypothetical protein
VVEEDAGFLGVFAAGAVSGRASLGSAFALEGDRSAI